MCYDGDGDSMTVSLKLVPINGNQEDIISLQDVELLAFTATTLSPLDSFSEIDGYTSALWEEMQSRKFKEKDLFNKYDKLIHATNGFKLLKVTIQLFLIEKDLRNIGINQTLITQYEKLQQEYELLLRDLQ